MQYSSTPAVQKAARDLYDCGRKVNVANRGRASRLALKAGSPSMRTQLATEALSWVGGMSAKHACAKLQQESWQACQELNGFTRQ